MFEKIHSYQFREQLKEEMDDVEGQLFLVPITVHEKIWLKTLLQTDVASLFLSKETIHKLKYRLEDIEGIKQEYIIEKFKTEIVEDVSRILYYHKMIRDCISNKMGMVMTYQTNDQSLYKDIKGIPYKLEYLAHKKQWNVLWYPIEGENTALFFTPLRQIQCLNEFHVDPVLFDKFETMYTAYINEEKIKAVLAINYKVFPENKIEEEKQRIFYALSCFEKEVSYESNSDIYEITIYYREFETENLLQKIRLLGRKIIIQRPDSLKIRMRETALKALERYQN